MKGRISAVIITFNEESNIERCLKSLEGVADEIVVVDSCSTDRTAEICERYGTSFIQRPWTNYADQKNFANSKARYPYILSLDADEALSPELRASITTWKKEVTGEAFSMNRRSNYAGKWIAHSGWYPDRKVRLFKKGIAEWGGPIPHETLHVQDGVKVRHMAGDLLHFPFETVGQHYEKARFYAKLAAEELRNRSTPYLILKLLFSPAHRFIKTYIVQLGLLDGLPGLQICAITAMEVWMKYSLALKRKSN